MANYANLLATIAANIYTNHNNEVTAAGVQAAANAMVASLGAKYQYAGVASPNPPGTYDDDPEQNVFYIATEAGVYPDFGGLEIDGTQAVIFTYDGVWSKQSIGVATTEPSLESLPFNAILTGYYLSGYGGYLTTYANNSYMVCVASLRGGEELSLHASGPANNGAYTFLDSSDNIIAYGRLNTAFTEEVFNITAPVNAAKVYVACYGTAWTSYVRKYVLPRKWSDKTWVVLGDSLTEVNARASMRYYDFVSEKTGISVINRGISGTGYKNGEASNNAFYQRAASVPQCDVLTVFGSFNDNVYFSDMGTKDDTTAATIGGCINLFFDNLFAAYPLVNVGIVSPTPWQYFYPGVANPDAYVKLLEDICLKRGIPYFDLYHCSGLRPWDATYRTLCYSKDGGGGVHPDETGHRLIAPRFEDFLNRLLL